MDENVPNSQSMGHERENQISCQRHTDDNNNNNNDDDDDDDDDDGDGDDDDEEMRLFRGLPKPSELFSVHPGYVSTGKLARMETLPPSDDSKSESDMEESDRGEGCSRQVFSGNDNTQGDDFMDEIEGNAMRMIRENDSDM
jgi:hypothetical protein